ncbi:hypothetical protein [Azospirillum largimobile]
MPTTHENSTPAPVTSAGRGSPAGLAAEEAICPKLFTSPPHPFKRGGHFVQSAERLSGMRGGRDHIPPRRPPNEQG